MSKSRNILHKALGLDSHLEIAQDPAVIEVQFDKLVGPTHHFGGLAFGNRASMEHEGALSHPKQAALEGLEKMWLLARLGFKQAVLPFQLRPKIETLRALGFSGKDPEVIKAAGREAPRALQAASSSASMWMANSATVIPSSDSRDGKLHLFIANLKSSLHREIEAEETELLFRKIFGDETLFMVHSPLPVADEGAANHTRLFAEGESVHLFTYGVLGESRFPARQSKEAGEAIKRFTGIKRALFLKQSVKAIDAGVFHSDVISTGNSSLFLYHKEAFTERFDLPKPFQMVEIDSISLDEAVKSYFFNSQLLTLPEGMLLLTPKECEAFPAVEKLIQRLIEDPKIPIVKRVSVSLKESMQGGGGPACLRLRVPMSERELHAINPGLFLDEALYKRLKAWIESHYRDTLSLDDLKDPKLFEESVNAKRALREILPYAY